MTEKYYKFNLICDICKTVREVLIPVSEPKPVTKDLVLKYIGTKDCEKCNREFPGLIAVPDIVKMINAGTFPIRELDEEIPRTPKAEDKQRIEEAYRGRKA